MKHQAFLLLLLLPQLGTIFKIQWFFKMGNSFPVAFHKGSQARNIGQMNSVTKMFSIQTLHFLCQLFSISSTSHHPTMHKWRLSEPHCTGLTQVNHLRVRYLILYTSGAALPSDIKYCGQKEHRNQWRHSTWRQWEGHETYQASVQPLTASSL